MKKSILAIVLATIWISVSEFVRNEFLFKDHWVNHYSENVGMNFPSEPVNGGIWGLWSLLFAVFLFFLNRRFSLKETIGLSWLAGFVLMWLVTGNLGVLPYGLLIYAVPLSLIEVIVASLIIRKLSETPFKPSQV